MKGRGGCQAANRPTLSVDVSLADQVGLSTRTGVPFCFEGHVKKIDDGCGMRRMTEGTV